MVINCKNDDFDIKSLINFSKCMGILDDKIV